MNAVYQTTADAVATAQSVATTQAGRASNIARRQVYPAVQPYTNYAYKSIEPHVNVASDLSRKHVQPVWRDLERRFDSVSGKSSKLQSAVSAALILVIALWLVRTLFSWLLAKPKATLIQRTVRLAKSLPGIKGAVQKRTASTIDNVRSKMDEKDPAVEKMSEIPQLGLDPIAVMNELEDRAVHDFRCADGESKASGTIYMSGECHRDLLNDAYCMFSQANPLHASLFPSVRRMEAEVLSMTASLLGGGSNGVSTVCFSSCCWLSASLLLCASPPAMIFMLPNVVDL
jgi:sphinganine-1-phosphate aldolase